MSDDATYRRYSVLNYVSSTSISVDVRHRSMRVSNSNRLILRRTIGRKPIIVFVFKKKEIDWFSNSVRRVRFTWNVWSRWKNTVAAATFCPGGRDALVAGVGDKLAAASPNKRSLHWTRLRGIVSRKPSATKNTTDDNVRRSCRIANTVRR